MTTAEEIPVMAEETPSPAMGYVCVDLVKTMTGLDFQMRAVAKRLGYLYTGIAKGSTLIVPEALVDHVTTHQIELVIIPDIAHLRGRIPEDLAAVTDIYNLATNEIHERHGGFQSLEQPEPAQGS